MWKKVAFLVLVFNANSTLEPRNCCKNYITAFEGNREDMQKHMTPAQFNKFYYLLSHLKGATMENYKVVFGVLLVAFSQDLDLEKMKDDLDFARGFFSGYVVNKLIEVGIKNGPNSIPRVVSLYDEYFDRTRRRAFLKTYSNRPYENDENLLAKIRENIKIVPGFSTRKFDRPETMAQEILDGIFTISLKPMNAHGRKGSHPIITMLHDYTHYQDYICSIEVGLLKYVQKRIAKAKKLDLDTVEVEKTSLKTAGRLFEEFQKCLKKFIELFPAALYPLFYLLHEKSLINMDWELFAQMPSAETAINALAPTYQTLIKHHAQWESPQDPFDTWGKDMQSFIGKNGDLPILSKNQEVNDEFWKNFPGMKDKIASLNQDKESVYKDFMQSQLDELKQKELLNVRFEASKLLLVGHYKEGSAEAVSFQIASSLNQKAMNLRDNWFLVWNFYKKTGRDFAKFQLAQDKQSAIAQLNYFNKMFFKMLEDLKLNARMMTKGLKSRL